MTLLAWLAVTALGPVRADEDWLARSRAILDAASRQSRPDWLEGNPAAEFTRQQAKEIAGFSRPAHPESQVPSSGPDIGSAPSRQFVLFASTALDASELDALFEEASGQADVLVVFRGPKPGQKLPAFVREIHGRLKQFEPDRMPRVVLDPQRFRTAGVSVVPTLVLEEHGRVVARVSGVTGIRWFRSRLEHRPPADASTPLDPGTLGPTREIAEVDLIEEMQRRLAGIDWAAKQREALAQFWRHRVFLDLPEASVERVREIDPTVTAPREILAPDGTPIVRAGQRINPLETLPFRQRLVVFDATRPAQVEQARRLGREAGERRVVFIATRLDRDRGWADLTALETEFGAPVYLLTADLKARFDLEAVPAVVEAAGRVFRIREFPIRRTP